MLNPQKTIDELAEEEKRKYFRQWRAKNKDKVKKSNQNYWRKKAEQSLKEKEE